MISFLRPFIIVTALSIAFSGFAVWTQMGNWTEAEEVVAHDVGADSNMAQERLDWMFAPMALLPEQVKSELGWIDFGAYAIALGFVGWLFLESAWAFLFPQGESRSLIPRFRFSKLLCLGLFAMLIYFWVTQRYLVLV